jgi:hypothetical protein
MAQVIRDLQQGKPVQLSYRHRIIGVLHPTQPQPVPIRRGSAQAIQNFLKFADFGLIPTKLKESGTTIKQQIADLRSRDLNSK